MKEKILDKLRNGCLIPDINKIASELNSSPEQVKELIQNLEQENIIKGYDPILDYSKINKSFCVITLINLEDEEYSDPEKIALDLAQKEEVESLHVCTGDWEIIMKVRTKNQHEYYNFMKDLLKRKGIARIKSQNSLKQIKNGYVYD